MRRLGLLLLCLMFFTPAFSTEVKLPVRPVYQQTPVWCWAAVGSMVFDYYGVANLNCAGNQQCAVVALLHPKCDALCFSCVIPAGSLAVMNNMLKNYPAFARKMSGIDTRISTQPITKPLSLQELKQQIDKKMPVVAGISPSGYKSAGVSEHVALIVGYEGDNIIVNDPFPFQIAFTTDPYLKAGASKLDQEGQYKIAYSRFVNDLQWKETVYDIKCNGKDCRNGGPVLPPSCGQSCQTVAGTCGPFMHQPPRPLGGPCHCQFPLPYPPYSVVYQGRVSDL